jgi:radical SAM superfamily enzyme YgiQ (UPF0313 family)
LDLHGCSTGILNLDYTGAAVHCTWAELFKRSTMLRAAIEADTPLLYEAAELIVGHSPDAVVLACGDSLTPWVDVGNAYLTAKLARMLQPHVRELYGVGPRLKDTPAMVTGSFSAVFDRFDPSGILRTICSASLNGPSASRRDRLNWLPAIESDLTGSRYDVVLTSVGCVEQCSFCDAASQGYGEVPADIVAQDVGQRSMSTLDIGDSIFLARRRRIDDLLRAFEARGGDLPNFSAESHIAYITDERLRQLTRLGVRELKVGLESGDVDALVRMNKTFDLNAVVERLQAVRAAGMDLTIYVLLGGPIGDPVAAAERTLSMCSRLPITDLVVNVWAYNRPDPQPYDCHFSWDLVMEYGLRNVMGKFFSLQASHKTSIGRLVKIGD